MKKLILAFHLLFFSFSILVLASAQEIRTVDGVRMIHNIKGGKWGRNLPFKIRLMRTIGDINATDENLAFHMPSDISVDEAGNLFILDSGNHRIQKFSPEGKYIATVGRKGQGPREFNSPLSIDIDVNGYLYISDPNNRRIHILTPEGGEYKTIRPTKHSLSEACTLNSGYLAMKGTVDYSIDDETEAPLPKLIRILDSEGMTCPPNLGPGDMLEFNLDERRRNGQETLHSRTNHRHTSGG
ncbi:MAG: NHL repeat-containing protein [Candidatus Aminicenantes bacterium]|nr:NHL repeat-containing protein [Candidatus Aminicenantes bacterium]MDH5706448.1 NHL repeat-containing protein [Candidatus Aminicenantes bacterium]